MRTEKLKVATLKAHATENTPEQELSVYEHIAPDMSSVFTVQYGDYPGTEFTTLNHALNWAASEINATLQGSK